MLVSHRCAPFLSESKILGDSYSLLSKKEKQKALCYSFIKKDSLCQPTNPVNKIILNVIIGVKTVWLEQNIFIQIFFFFSFDPV